MLLQISKENSQQAQIEKCLAIGGFDEKTAREIFGELFSQTRIMLTKEAVDIAKKRVAEFEKVLMEKIRTTVGGFSMFRDPWFYFQLVEAQKASATSGSYDDYDLLASLLLSKYIESDDDLDNSTSVINQAIKVIRSISEQTLTGFTVICSIDYIRARKCRGIIETVDYYENRYSKLLSSDLPEDKLEFQYEIQALKLCKVNFNSKSLLDCEEILFSVHHRNLIEVGIKKDSKQYITAIEIIKRYDLFKENILVGHELNFDYVRIALGRRKDIDELDYSDSQKAALHSIFDLYVRDEAAIEENLVKLRQIWLERPILKKISDFYNSGSPLTFTILGIRLATANLSRLKIC